MKWEKKKREGKKKEHKKKHIWSSRNNGVGKTKKEPHCLHLTKFDEDKRTKHKRIYKEHNNTPSLKK
jgi:hypothetical protein